MACVVSTMTIDDKWI